MAWLLWASACRPTAGTIEPTAEPAARPITEAARGSQATPTTGATTTTPSATPGPTPTSPIPTGPSTTAKPTPSAPTEVTTAAFDRSAWPHWIDADGDCQDTRTEVLVAESEIDVTFTDGRGCEVAAGRWRCPYTDRTVTDPRELDVDHLVPLAHAHDAGAASWDRARRQAFANDLGDPDHLVAVLARANRSKGARDAAAWLPEEPGFRCEYVAAWRRIKQRWQLAESADERAAIDAALRTCAAHGVPDRPGATRPAVPHDPSGERPGQCCRVCKSGKPCGDACIAADKTCRKPPGCAC